MRIKNKQSANKLTVIEATYRLIVTTCITSPILSVELVLCPQSPERNEYALILREHQTDKEGASLTR